MNVNQTPTGQLAVNAQQLNDRLLQAIQQRRNAPPPRELETLPAPRTPLPAARTPLPAPLPNWGGEINYITADQAGDISDAILQDCPGQCTDLMSQTHDDPVQSLLNSWNTSDPQNDLNGDGTVNIFDLFQLISQLDPGKNGKAEAALSEHPSGAALKPIPRPDANPHVKPADDTAVAESDTNALSGADGAADDQSAPLTIDGLLAAWNAEGGHYDVNSDGTVNVFDLFQLLASLQPAQPQAGSGKNAEIVSADTFDELLNVRTPAEHRLTEQKLQNMADRLTRRLHDAGFVQHPPANLSDILNQIELSDEQRQIMLDRLAHNYPAGLGISMIG